MQRRLEGCRCTSRLLFLLTIIAAGFSGCLSRWDHYDVCTLSLLLDMGSIIDRSLTNMRSLCMHSELHISLYSAGEQTARLLKRDLNAAEPPRFVRCPLSFPSGTFGGGRYGQETSRKREWPVGILTQLLSVLPFLLAVVPSTGSP